MPLGKIDAIRSDAVQEILTRVPHWMIRWGNTLFLSLFLGLIVMSFLIEYPDTVDAKIAITTQTPPERIVARSTGRIEAILTSDKARVKAGQPVAIIESNADYQDVFRLKVEMKKYETDSMLDMKKFERARLGDIRNLYDLFCKSDEAVRLDDNLAPFEIEKRARSSEYKQIKARLDILERQKILNENELVLQKSEMSRYEKLHDKGVVSTQDYENKKLALLQADRNYQTLLSTISSLKSSMIENVRTTKGTGVQAIKEKIALRRNRAESFYLLEKAVRDWELRYVLYASVSGQLNFLQVWNSNQVVTSGDAIFSVIPEVEGNYLGKLVAPSRNAGKIKAGQRVVIHLSNFPDYEFGTIEGRIRMISLTPDKDGNILADVIFPHGLRTSYRKKIVLQQEMGGTAEIITEDVRLAERFFYQFRTAYSR